MKMSFDNIFIDFISHFYRAVIKTFKTRLCKATNQTSKAIKNIEFEEQQMEC
jgi:hypothetical protein